MGKVYEPYLAKGKDVLWVFMDLEKAYDRNDEEELWTVLRLPGLDQGCSAWGTGTPRGT